jgi:hypothetical protein
MSEMIAYCGLVCHTCPIYLATREEDKEEQSRMRARIAALSKEQYGLNYGPEDITDCDGCLTEHGRLFVGCLRCDIRTCARQKGIENCAHCAGYICEKLKTFFATDPDAKTRLDEVRCSFSLGYEKTTCSIPPHHPTSKHPGSKPETRRD